MSRYYVLDKSGAPVAISGGVLEWALWFEHAHRQVDRTDVGRSNVSTVFLGLNHSFQPTGQPILWETMVFSGKLDGHMDRCGGTKEQAEAMHVAMVAEVTAAEGWRVPVYAFLREQLYDLLAHDYYDRCVPTLWSAAKHAAHENWEGVCTRAVRYINKTRKVALYA